MGFPARFIEDINLSAAVALRVLAMRVLPLSCRVSVKWEARKMETLSSADYISHLKSIS
jgi:hypothetical protein